MPLCKPVKLAGASLALLACVMAAAPGRANEAAAAPLSQACRTAGAWLEPATGRRLSSERLMASLAARKIVLLGEIHTSKEHHRWQLHMLAGLRAHRAALVVGFEMFPRSVQPVLDAWPMGDLSEAGFLEAARWNEVWGYDADLYLPLFYFIRQHRVPMVALNVDRALVRRVGKEGWRAIPPDAREGISDPAPATEAYRQRLARVYRAELAHRKQRPAKPVGDDQEIEAETAEIPGLSTILESAGFQHFVEAQTTWDRAMAEALATARRANPEALVIGVMGRGHIEQGHGVPDQLAALGEKDVTVLLPVETGPDCEALEAGVADAVFLLAPGGTAAPEAAKPRLGVFIEASAEGVRVTRVVEGSVAETAGLAAGDVILKAADIPVTGTSELVEIVQRQAPGTWLPLDVRRAGEDRRVVAKFPTRFE